MGGRGAAFESKGYSSAIKTAENKIYKDKVETAVLLDSKGNTIFTHSNNASNYVRFTPEQLVNMKGGNLTHNHPSNSTFSGEDISLLTYRGLKTIRATGQNRTYQLTEIKGNFPRNEFAKAFTQVYNENKKQTDKEYRKIKKSYQYTDPVRFQKESESLRVKLNNMNSEWLKNNSKKYGYRYSVIERR